MPLKILARKVHYSEPYYDSGKITFTVRSKTMPTLTELAEANVRYRYCNHLHDCCGCMQYDTPWVEWRNKRNEWRVTQNFYRNV